MECQVTWPLSNSCENLTLSQVDVRRAVADLIFSLDKLASKDGAGLQHKNTVFRCVFDGGFLLHRKGQFAKKSAIGECRVTASKPKCHDAQLVARCTRKNAMMTIGLGLNFAVPIKPANGSVQSPLERIGATAIWDARDVTNGSVSGLPDLAGGFDLSAVNPPTALNGVVQFDGGNDALQSAAPGFLNPTPGVVYQGEYSLPDADGGDAGQGFSICGFAQDTDGTWWAGNGGLNWDGSGAERRQSIVHLSADFSTNLGEIDIDALWDNDESPQGVAVDVANNWLWVLDPSGQRIRSVDRDGTRNNSFDIARSYDVGSVCMASSGDALWVMSRGAGNATIQKITTDGSKQVLVNQSVDLDGRHDHIFEYDGLLYITCGTNGAQAFIVVLDAVTLTRLGLVELPYPESINGMVGIEGIWVGPEGQCLISHNGYFHYGDPSGTKQPVALNTFPRTNIVVEYKLPVMASRNLDLFWLGAADPSGLDCAFQVGSPTDKTKSFPSVGLFINGGQGSIDVRKNTVTGSSGDFARIPTSVSEVSLIYIQLRGADVTLYQNGVEIGTDTLDANADGTFGMADHRPEIGGSVTNGNRYTEMDWLSGGIILGGDTPRNLVEGFLAWRHGRVDLLPVGHPYKNAAPR